MPVRFTLLTDKTRNVLRLGKFRPGGATPPAPGFTLVTGVVRDSPLAVPDRATGSLPSSGTIYTRDSPGKRLLSVLVIFRPPLRSLPGTRKGTPGTDCQRPRPPPLAACWRLGRAQPRVGYRARPALPPGSGLAAVRGVASLHPRAPEKTLSPKPHNQRPVPTPPGHFRNWKPRSGTRHRPARSQRHAEARASGLCRSPSEGPAPRL